MPTPATRLPAHQLEYFVAVAEEGQFTRAAARLHVAQPSVSAQIRRLERSLGTPLFHRGPGPVTLTSAGEAVLPVARRVLADLQEVADVITDLHGLRRGHVAIGATPSLSAALLPPIISRFRRHYPGGVQLAVTERGSRHLMDGLESGVLDVALAILTVPRPSLESVALATEELVVVTPHGHPLGRGRSRSGFVEMAELSTVPMVMFREGYDLRSATWSAFERLGLVPEIAVEGGEMAGVLELVAQGVGIAVVPSIVADRPRLEVLRLRPPGLTRTIGLVRRRDREPSRAAAAFFAEVTGMLAESGWPGHVPSGLAVSEEVEGRCARPAPAAPAADSGERTP